MEYLNTILTAVLIAVGFIVTVITLAYHYISGSYDAWPWVIQDYETSKGAWVWLLLVIIYWYWVLFV